MVRVRPVTVRFRVRVRVGNPSNDNVEIPLLKDSMLGERAIDCSKLLSILSLQIINTAKIFCPSNFSGYFTNQIIH